MTNKEITIEEAKKMLEAKLKCLKREISGIDCNDGYNCDECELLYAQGTVGEQKEVLDMAIRALEVVQGMEEVFLKALPELDMREATEEERSSLKRYIDSISQSTGVKFDFNGVKTELEPCVDCVSREALKEKKVYSEERHEYVVPIAVIDWLSSVKPQRPKGKWIPLEGDLKKCPVCGEHSLCPSKFCCSCGAELEV